jgi:hypothetical protein
MLACHGESHQYFAASSMVRGIGEYTLTASMLLHAAAPPPELPGTDKDCLGGAVGGSTEHLPLGQTPHGPPQPSAVTGHDGCEWRYLKTSVVALILPAMADRIGCDWPHWHDVPQGWHTGTWQTG